MEWLRKEKDDAEQRANTTGAEAFQQAVDLIEFLAPWVDFDYYDGNHYVRDDKIWLGNQMVLDAALHRKALLEAREAREKSSEDEPVEKKIEDEVRTGEA